MALPSSLQTVQKPVALLPGLLTAHKPVGVSSFSLVHALQEEAARAGGKTPAICHGGTLDPFAEGLLLLLVGPATRVFPLLHDLPKTYVAEVAWGLETETGDAGGKPVLRGPADGLTPERLEATLAAQLGWQEQVPPTTSAKKVRGEPAYRRVWRGEEVVLPPSRVYLHAARWLAHRLPTHSTLELTCRGGYYVRALARELGRALGCGAHLTALSRPRIGPWSDPGPGGARHHAAGSALLPFLPERDLSDQEVGVLRRREAIAPGPTRASSWPWPRGFPPPQPRVAGLHQGRLRFVLAPLDDGRWEPELELGRGV